MMAEIEAIVNLVNGVVWGPVMLIMILGALAPRLAKELNERTDRSSLMQKGAAFMMVIVGVYFVS